MIPSDKRKHLLAGAACGLAGTACALLMGLPHAWISGVLAALIAGVGKELYDRDRQEAHTVEWLDALCTVVGGAVASPLLWVVA